MFAALHHNGVNWTKPPQPAPYSEKQLQTVKEAEEQKRKKQARWRRELQTWNRMLDCFVLFFFNYGAVRKSVSSSKSQVNATQSAIDKERHVHQQTTTILSYSKPEKRAHHTCQGARLRQDPRKTDLVKQHYFRSLPAIEWSYIDRLAE